MIKAILHKFDGVTDPSTGKPAGLGDRVSLRVDSNFIFSLTYKGVQFLSAAKTVLACGDNGIPVVFRDSCHDWKSYTTINQVELNGLKIYLKKNGNDLLIASYTEDSEESRLLKISPEGLYRYAYIDDQTIKLSGWPVDSLGRLQIVRPK